MRVLQDSHACLFSGRLKDPAGFDIVKQRREREHKISILDPKHNPVISPSYAMLSIFVAYMEVGLHCTPNHRGNVIFLPLYVQTAGPAKGPQFKAPGYSQLSSKHFPSQRSNHLPSDRPLGVQIQDQAQSRVQGESGRERKKGNVSKKEEK